MVSRVVLSFILGMYSNDYQLTYSLIRPSAVVKRVLWIRSVHPSVRNLSWNWLFSFLWNSTWCEDPMWSCAWQSWIFWKQYLCPQNGENRSSQGFFKCIGKFSYFFSIWSTMKVYINFCMLKQISYLLKIWFLR